MLPQQYDITASNEARAALHPIDRAENIEDLERMATAAAAKQVSMEDFDGFL